MLCSFATNCLTQKRITMKKFYLFISLILSAATMNADIIDLHLKKPTGSDRNEVVTEPQASYDDQTNEVTIEVEAESFFEMKVIDIYGTTVFSCPVLMVDGTPTNYQLPELPAGIYTLKVESNDVSYEGTLVIE